MAIIIPTHEDTRTFLQNLHAQNMYMQLEHTNIATHTARVSGYFTRKNSIIGNCISLSFFAEINSSPSSPVLTSLH